MPPSDVRTKFDIPRNTSIESLGSAGGFSGARFWQVDTIEETYCLRRWPREHPTAEQLEWIHRVLLHCANQGISQVDAPLKTVDGATFVKSEHHLWQMSPWKEGTANFSDEPSDEKLVNAVTALAQFHLAAAQVNLDFRVSTNVARRMELLDGVVPWLAQVGSAPAHPHPLIEDFRTLFLPQAMVQSKRLYSRLALFRDTILPIQPVIRDIWHDHVLFEGDEVSGIIDFGSMEMDTVCLDIARLLGSLIADDEEKWQLAINTYTGMRALTEPERELIAVLDQTVVWLGGLNWLKWLYLEQCEFEDLQAVTKRLEQLQMRMSNQSPGRGLIS